MKKIITILIIMMSLGYFFVTTRTSVEAGEEAVVIKKPWFFGKSGIEKKPISTGTIWAVASTEVKMVSLKAFTIKESFAELFTEDSIPIELTIILSFKNKKGESILLVEQFGESEEWYRDLLFNPLQSSLEIAVKKRTFEEISKNSDTLKEIKQDIIFGVKDFLKKQTIPVELLDITFGKIVPPKKIVYMAIDVEVEKENLKVQELRKKIVALSAEADRAYMLKMNMSPREYLKMKQIELENQKLLIQRLAIENAKDSNGSIKIEIKMEKL